VDHRLVHVDRPILRVPNIAIHLHRETNDKLDMNKEKHLSVLHSAASSCTEPQGLCLYQASVRLSVPAWAHSSQPAAAGLLLWAQPAGDIDRLPNGAHQCGMGGGECGQCHVVSLCRKLNTDLFQMLYLSYIMR